MLMWVGTMQYGSIKCEITKTGGGTLAEELRKLQEQLREIEARMEKYNESRTEG